MQNNWFACAWIWTKMYACTKCMCKEEQKVPEITRALQKKHTQFLSVPHPFCQLTNSVLYSRDEWNKSLFVLLTHVNNPKISSPSTYCTWPPYNYCPKSIFIISHNALWHILFFLAGNIRTFFTRTKCHFLNPFIARARDLPKLRRNRSNNCERRTCINRSVHFDVGDHTDAARSICVAP